MKKLFGQYLRFELAGSIIFALDYGITYLLTEWMGINYLLSNGVAFVVATTTNYFITKHFVFRESLQKSSWSKFGGFVLLNLLRLGINQGIVWFATEKIGLYYMVSKLFSTLFSKVYNFITQKLLFDRVEH